MSVQNAEWWTEPLRVIQTNLQVKDTDKIDPEQLAQQIADLGGNTLVFNVGGIYAWYDTAIPFHVKNGYLPEGRDLVKEAIEACHRRNIRFVARADFGKAQDSVYLKKPQWFTTDSENKPKVVAAERPGEWSLIMSTCLNGGYQNDEVAIPVLYEIMDRYDVDGLFVNSFFYVPCCCEACKKKYFEKYGCEMPKDKADYNPMWTIDCMHDAMEYVQAAVKKKNSKMSMFFYSYPFIADDKETDLVCAEPHNMLFFGSKKLSESFKPSLNMKLCRSLPVTAKPIAIVHSSPGLVWRHVGMPTEEYLFWTSQVPANGGQLWHSLTGIPETVGDSRILDTVKTVNGMIKKVEPYMHTARPAAQTAILWTNDKSSEFWFADEGPCKSGWAEVLTVRQIPFEILMDRYIDLDALQQYKVVILPSDFGYTDEIVKLLTEYVEQGGKIIAEGKIPKQFEGLHDLFGIETGVYDSPELLASYLRFRGTDNPLQKGLEFTDLIAHSGRVAYCTAKEGTQTLATLVPPFAPGEGVGAPPERASIPEDDTDLPLCVLTERNKGKVLYMPFFFSEIICKYRMLEHYQIFANMMEMLLGEDQFIKVSHYPSLQLACFQSDEYMVVNLINGTGNRPLMVNTPLYDIEIEVKVPADKRVSQVRKIMSDETLSYTEKQGKVFVTLDKLTHWESLLIETQSR